MKFIWRINKMINTSLRRSLSLSSRIDVSTQGSQANSLHSIYHQYIQSQGFTIDTKQLKLLSILEKIRSNLISPQPCRKSSITCDSKDNENTNTESKKTLNNLEYPLQLRGLYIHGPVGTGKTMIMDMFFNNCNIENKRRVHFHKFMLDVHQRIHKYKQEIIQKYGRNKHISLKIPSERDAIVQVGREIANECKLLCFDEFQVTDICDAMILMRLFNEIWANGTVLVATSNRKPDELYQDGVNRHYFLPFINQLQKMCIIRNIGSDVDYRLLGKVCYNESQAYFTPLTESNSKKLLSLFEDDANKLPIELNYPIAIMMGRKFILPKVCIDRSSCWIDFKTLCEDDRGASDYRALTSNFDNIFLDGVPGFNILNHDIARRFITFIDEVYDAKCILTWTAMYDPHELFRNVGTTESLISQDSQNVEIIRGDDTSTFRQTQVCIGSKGEEDVAEILRGELASIKELSFAFKRAASRLYEMSSECYRKK